MRLLVAGYVNKANLLSTCLFVMPFSVIVSLMDTIVAGMI